jgi:hypothetical protein
MRNPAPGGALLHPVTLSALCTLALNDQVLKHMYPSWLTGKLSDVAGVVLLPVFLHALCELAAARIWRKPFSAADSDRWLLACVVTSLLAFALPEIWRPAELVYRYGLGAARWPFRALAALWSSQALPNLRPVRATADVTDLLALPMGFVAFAVGRRGPRPTRGRARAATLAGAFLAFSLSAKPAAAASSPFSHDGFYLSMEAGPGALWVSSSGSISNGFRQELPSSASAPVAPATALALGGTFAKLVLGGRLAVANGVSPVIKTLGERFIIPQQHLLLIELGPMVQYYPDSKRGLHFGAAFGFAWLGPTGGNEGAAPGFSGSLEAGHGFFFARQWSLGVTLRMTVAHTYSHANVDVSSTTFMPALLATVTLH